MGNITLIKHLRAAGVLRKANIRQALEAVDRVDFVPEKSRKEAHLDLPLPIGGGQTISQPQTVAVMLSLLSPRPGDRVLDVGSGSGWTTALLAFLVGAEGSVVGIEVRPDLVAFGRDNLSKYDFPNARIERAGNALGLSEEAPFDRILASAAGDKLPKELMKQLTIGGIGVFPVRNSLWKVSRRSGDQFDKEEHPGFVFVPLVLSGNAR